MQSSTTSSTCSQTSTESHIKAPVVIQLPPQQPSADNERLQVTRMLGDGGQAKVFAAESATYGPLAVKVYNDASLTNANGSPQREFKLLKKLSGNVNILRVHDFQQKQGQL